MMAPLKPNNSNNLISSRRKPTVICPYSKDPKQDGISSKRKADCPPFKENRNTKRIAFVERNIEEIVKVTTHKKKIPFKESKDILQWSNYTLEIFNYLKERESSFQIIDYLDRQICLTKLMRSLLVNWMVDIQVCFEFHQETLYLGVKLVDMYLAKMTIGKETLQLVGATAMFVASKFDARNPYTTDDFLSICDGAYTKQELLRMEINLLKLCGFDLGIPISYKFLGIYASCAKITVPIMTLAQFILEYALMDYDTITIRDSKLAAAALFIALKMKKVSNWNPKLEFYTGYKFEDIKDVAILLNSYLRQPPKSRLMNVRKKYSHIKFFEVAKIPFLETYELLH